MVLLIGTLGLSVSMSIMMMALEFDVLGIAGVMSVGGGRAGGWVVTGKGGDKRGRFGSDGERGLTSSSRLGGWG